MRTGDPSIPTSEMQRGHSIARSDVPPRGRCERETARLLAEGHVIGWFQGRMEWGPRALGNRSILADPRRADMKDVINSKIKFREPYRPFAPSVLEEDVAGLLSLQRIVAVHDVRLPCPRRKEGEFPAVTHVDGTARIQTVSRTHNPSYWALMNEFKSLTGVPVCSTRRST